MAASLAVLVGADGLAAALGPHLRPPLYWPTFEVQHKYGRMAQLGPSRTRVVLLGDSVLDSAADPEVMAAEGQPGVYNAALAGEPLPVLAEWAIRVVEPRFHPATVVLGFDINVVNGDLRSQLPLLAEFHHSRPVAVAEGRGGLFDHVDGWLERHVALYRDRSVLRQPFDPPATQGSLIYDPPLSPAGWNQEFREKQLPSSPAGLQQAAAELRAGLFARPRPSPAEAALIASLVGDLRRRGVRVVFVALPESPVLPIVVPGGAAVIDAERATMLGAARGAGAQVLVAGRWPAADFADGVHLDAAGSERFSQWLAQELRATG
ncbi:MAG TPA: hypothetical protein VKI19_01560 [Acidimicrobiales bacterium]|nr:hypothetical protein [Acidimicrobiales bacterium]